jgi:hypothetical protein
MERKILNKPMKSNRPDKKKMVYVKDSNTGKIKTIHFGAKGYRHNYSEKAWRSYRGRARGILNKKGQQVYKIKTSPAYWAYNYLWPGRKEWREK